MKQIAVLFLLLALSACSLPVFFRVPIVQGNVVTADQVAKLKKGMTKKQVAYVLGTPLVKPVFEKDRWDYVFYYRNPRAHVRQSKLDLYFTNGRLTDIEGNEEYTAEVAKANSQSDTTNVTPLPGDASTPATALSGPQRDVVPANASDNIPYSHTHRPGVEPNGPAENIPGSGTRAGGNGGPLPHAGAPLPGHPAANP
ncbi:MAG: outer membrane protein assembly factor BamE [Salinisphaera sp.]|jgi:outer membrane protein assembly factor BamE|nr:outer membrane protein assembly factor BamE [Salinisphaera sp.]